MARVSRIFIPAPTDSGVITGSGAVQAQDATAAGVALRVITGSGACAAQAATCSGYDAYTPSPNISNVLKENREFNVLEEIRVFTVGER